jgi:tetratricopeptide (TPR) repeat protein
MKHNLVSQRTYAQEFAYLYEHSRWTIYASWLVLGTAGGAFAGFMFSPLLDSPWWLLPAYVAAVYVLKRATTKLAEWFFAPDFWWQVTSTFLATFLLTCLACVVWLLTLSIWIGLPILIVVSFVIGLLHNLFRVVFVRNQFAWWYSAPLCATLATIPGWLLLSANALTRANPFSTAIAGAAIGFLYPLLATILLRLMWDVSAANSKLATIYVDKDEDFHEALVLHRHAIALKPDEPKLYAARAGTYLWQREIDRAKADIEHALALDPECPEARVLRAALIAEAGNLDQAIVEYDEILKYRPSFYLAYLNRARAYSQKGDFGRALDDYARAAPLGDDPAMALAYRADTYYRMGNYDDALADCNQVIENQTMTCVAYAMVLITRGKCYLAKGETKQGVYAIWSGLGRTNLPVLVREGEDALRAVGNETLRSIFAGTNSE